jgi:uncharacterized SAM-binding protein YcdF (DUF218 family)
MRLLRLGLTAALAVALLWAAGFVWFVRTASLPAAPPPHADAIVVLTGGSNRIEQALLLLARGAAPRLLVSGVTPGTSAAALVRAAGLDPASLADRITLGQSAVSTLGNAQETVEFVQRYTLHSLIVVTAFYHMPRALAELHHALPGIALYPVPVLPDAFITGLPLGLLAREYSKWLVVQLGVPHAAIDRRPGAGLK